MYVLQISLLILEESGSSPYDSLMEPEVLPPVAGENNTTALPTDSAVADNKLKTSYGKYYKQIVLDADFRVGRRIGRGNFGEVRLGILLNCLKELILCSQLIDARFQFE
jgi:hypothetical protein